MDTQTQQFVYRLLAVVLGLALLGTLGFVCAVALTQGDGEAVNVANTLTPWLMGTLAAIVAALVGHQLASVALAKFTFLAQNNTPLPVAVAALAGTPLQATKTTQTIQTTQTTQTASAPQEAPQPIPAGANSAAPVVDVPGLAIVAGTGV